eukprot:15367078-Ditylum_brightwellii.AAC.1
MPCGKWGVGVGIALPHHKAMQSTLQYMQALKMGDIVWWWKGVSNYTLQARGLAKLWMYVGRWGVCLEYYSMTSGYGLLGRVEILGNQLRKLVDGLRKFGNGIFVVWGIFWVVGGIFLLCMCNRVFGHEISRSGMLDPGLYHFEYVSWGVTSEDMSGCIVGARVNPMCLVIWGFHKKETYGKELYCLWCYWVGCLFGVLWVGCACLPGCWPEGVNISGGDGGQFCVLCVCAGQYVFWDGLAIICVCSCVCVVSCVGCWESTVCRVVVLLLVGRWLEFGVVVEGALAL